ncbi:hypothetical protein MFIFM68171_02250 [Madurella fahalii]|uniref:Uncharacterized protein n=1 Tax=Madurella fahalii TaxID=1157608 RepID=A0ABQ0G2S2_9PEZI
MTSVKTDQKTPNSSSKNNNKVNNEEKLDCQVCDKPLLWGGASHCSDCGYHHRRDICWWCNPEKAPDSWLKKKEALTRKAAKKSTTAPLHQQSGIAHPSITDDLRSILKKGKKPANPLSITNHDDDGDDGDDSDDGYNAIAMTNIPVQPHFRGGPRRRF